MGSDSDKPFRPGGQSEKQHAATSLDKGHPSKLKCAMMEEFGKLDDWDGVEKWGNPVAIPIVRITCCLFQEEQRRVVVGGKQAPPLMEV